MRVYNHSLIECLISYLIDHLHMYLSNPIVPLDLVNTDYIEILINSNVYIIKCTCFKLTVNLLLIRLISPNGLEDFPSIHTYYIYQ